MEKFMILLLRRTIGIEKRFKKYRKWIARSILNSKHTEKMPLGRAFLII